MLFFFTLGGIGLESGNEASVRFIIYYVDVERLVEKPQVTSAKTPGLPTLKIASAKRSGLCT